MLIPNLLVLLFVCLVCGIAGHIIEREKPEEPEIIPEPEVKEVVYPTQP